MHYIKANPNISFDEFLKLSSSVMKFSSLRGREYLIKNRVGTVIEFERLSTGKIWKMDLKKVYEAYSILVEFKTSDFKPYLNRTYSPALGLLLELKLLK